MIELQQIRSADPMPHPGHSGCAQQSDERSGLVDVSVKVSPSPDECIHTVRSIVYSRNVVHAPCNKECAIGRPSEVIYL